MRSGKMAGQLGFALRFVAATIFALAAAACSQGEEAIGSSDDGISDDDPGIPQAFFGERGEVRTGSLKIAGIARTTEYEVLHNQIVVEGDIVAGKVDPGLPDEEPIAEDDSVDPPPDLADDAPAAPEVEPGTTAGALATSVNQTYWPRGVVYYTVSKHLPDRSRVWNAMRHWKKHTPIRFIRRTTQPDFVTFAVGHGCSSTVGKVGGRQFVRLDAPKLCPASTVIHEIGHTVGFEHEHTRLDRDAHIKVFLSNAEAAARDQFTKKSTDVNLGAYDIHSVMHYASLSFSRAGKPTMLRRDGGMIPYNSRLSARDILAIRSVYKGM